MEHKVGGGKEYGAIWIDNGRLFNKPEIKYIVGCSALLQSLQSHIVYKVPPNYIDNKFSPI